MTTVSIEIDGKKIEARGDAMLIEAADEAGITIPRFCYHKKLSIAANCRMCLVEVEKAAKPLPACATPVTEGMKVLTRSPKAIRAQKNVMEFLLINHPLDCPICDQGGECELQDVAVGYGKDVSRFAENKRVVASKSIGPLIATDMTRCIHCTRCVRFGEEISGVRQLGATGRGEHMEIGTYIATTLDTEMSANVIDLCPVGALTSKPFRYTARAWEMTQHSSVAPHDCIGSNIFIHARRNEIMRVVPRENEDVNECWISDRDRFSYEGVNSADRVTAPMIKIDGRWQQTDWNTALDNVAIGLRKVVEKGADSLGCLISPSASVEELYLAQKLMRGLGSHNIDHRLHQTDFAAEQNAPAAPALGITLKQIEDRDAILLIGSNVRKDQPIAAHRLRMAALQGAKIYAVNPADYGVNFDLAHNHVVQPEAMVASLAAIASALLGKTGKSAPDGFAALSQGVAVTDSHQLIADGLIKAGNVAVIVGNYGNHHPQASAIHGLAELIARLADASYGALTFGANATGAWHAGAVPHRSAGAESVTTPGLNVRQMAETGLPGYLLVNVEPEYDTAYTAELQASLGRAEFVVALAGYQTDALLASANVILPSASFGETSGTLVNIEGRWQSFNGAVAPKGDARPAWKILRVLGNLLSVAGFDYMSSEEVLKDVKSKMGAGKSNGWGCVSASPATATDYARAGSVGIYAVDGIVRRAPALQQTADGHAVAKSIADNEKYETTSAEVEQA